MILGLSSYTFGWSVGVAGRMPAVPMTETELIQRTVDAGLTCLQIGDNLPLHQFSCERLDNLRARLKKEKIRLEVGARKLTEENLLQYVKLGEFFQSPLLRFIIDDAGYEPCIPTIVSLVKNQLPVLKEKGIRLGIENHDRFKAVELASMMEEIGDDNVGICLDCVNSLGAGEGIDHVSQVLAPYTINLHIKDYRIQRLRHKMGFIVEGCPAGKGMIRLQRLIELLTPHKRCESAVLEQWVVPESTIEETLAKEDQWAREGILYLKQQSLFEMKPNNIL